MENDCKNRFKGMNRTASLGTPNMAPKIEKEWQTQSETMEKRIIESIEKKLLENS